MKDTKTKIIAGLTIVGMTIAGVSTLDNTKVIQVSDKPLEEITIKVIRQADGQINLVDKDGRGVLLSDEDHLKQWVNDETPDDPWVMRMREVVKVAETDDSLLKHTDIIEVTKP